MTFTTVQHGDVTVLKVEGNLMGGPDASALNSKLHELVEGGTRQVVIDLRGVAFMNSSGLGLLIGGASMMKSAGGGLRLANASEKIMALIKITKLETLFDNYATVDDAVASFHR
jgi:anti-sigma B factor antagonist